MNSPPKTATVLLNAVCALFGMEESWEESKKLMANKAFFDHMINYDVDSMPMKLVRHVQTPNILLFVEIVYTLALLGFGYNLLIYSNKFVPDRVD